MAEGGQAACTATGSTEQAPASSRRGKPKKNEGRRRRFTSTSRIRATMIRSIRKACSMM
jgi:hypothetical protein